MNIEKLKEILNGIKTVSVGVIADFCVDIYWRADMKLSELSRETPHFPLPVIEERTSLGAGGNVAANLKALGVKTVYALSVTGRDWRAEVVKGLIKSAGIDGRFMITADGFLTPAYCKPLRTGINDLTYEDPRLDFENRSPISAQIEDEIIKNIDAIAKVSNVLIVSDQFKCGICSERVINCISGTAKRMPVFVDSRNNIIKYKNAFLKPNETEIYNAFHNTRMQITDLGAKLSALNKKEVIVTTGGNGAYIINESGFELIETVKEKPPVDVVGAGDTFISALAAGYAAKANLKECVELGHLASGVTVKKIGMTGTASAREIAAKFEERMK